MGKFCQRPSIFWLTIAVIAALVLAFFSLASEVADMSSLSLFP